MTSCCLVVLFCCFVSEELAASDFRISLIQRLDCSEKWGKKVPSKYQEQITNQPGVTSQKTLIFINNALKTSNHRNFNARLLNSVSYIMGRHDYVCSADLYPIFTDYVKLSWTIRKSEKNFTQAPYLFCTVQSTENYLNKSAHFNTVITTYHLRALNSMSPPLHTFPCTPCYSYWLPKIQTVT
jgi:hypothetical protein